MFRIISVDVLNTLRFRCFGYTKDLSYKCVLLVTFMSGNENHKSNDFFSFYIFHFIKALRSSCSGIFWNSAVESVFINVSCLSSYMDIFLGFFWNSQNIFSLEQLWMTASKLFGTFSWKFPVIDLFCLKPFHLSFDK